MLGKARLEIPLTDNSDAIRVDGLSDVLAMSYGRLFARTLSEQNGYVEVTLSDGTEKVIGHDTIRNELTIGRLVYDKTGK